MKHIAIDYINKEAVWEKAASVSYWVTLHIMAF